MPITLDCLPVQSFHNTTANFTVHTSVTFLVNCGERPLLMVYLLKPLEMSPFRWRWSCTCAINRLGHAFRHAQNVFTNGGLILIYLACSFAETSSALCLPRTRRALPRVNLHYFCLSHMHNTSKSDFGKFWHKRFSHPWEKSKTQCLLLLFFMNDRIQNF